MATPKVGRINIKFFVTRETKLAIHVLAAKTEMTPFTYLSNLLNTYSYLCEDVVVNTKANKPSCKMRAMIMEKELLYLVKRVGIGGIFDKWMSGLIMKKMSDSFGDPAIINCACGCLKPLLFIHPSYGHARISHMGHMGGMASSGNRPVQEAIYAYMSENRKEVTPIEVAESMELSKSNTSKLMGIMDRDGVIKRIVTGFYVTKNHFIEDYMDGWRGLRMNHEKVMSSIERMAKFCGYGRSKTVSQDTGIERKEVVQILDYLYKKGFTYRVRYGGYAPIKLLNKK